MNLSHRLQCIIKLFPDSERLGFSGLEDLNTWVISELGDLNALDEPIKTDVGWKRAKAVKTIYHVCAGNVAVSAETSLLISMVLGSEAVFKLPSVGLPELEQRIEQLPEEWRKHVRLMSEHDPAVMRECDAVVVFGSDKTVESVVQECLPEQKVLRYGHKLSLGYVTEEGATRAWAEAAAREILAYQQLGCLSPQSYLCADSNQAAVFAEQLVAVLAAQPWDELRLSFEAKAVIFDARQRAIASGSKVTIPKEEAPWTVVLPSEPSVRPGPGFGFITVAAAGSELMDLLEPWRGKISSVSLSGDHITPEQWKFWEGLGVHRFCRMGNLQRPPISWPHDGRPRLADLVTWTYADPDLSVIG